MAAKRISRALTGSDLGRMQADFADLAKRVRASKGQLDICLRGKYFNLYYRGSSLARVTFCQKDIYRIEIHQKYVDNDLQFPLKKMTGQYLTAELSADELPIVFGPAAVKSLQAMVRKVSPGEEIAFEQLLMAHNPPTPRFLFIDRQVAPPGAKLRMDLLALRQVDSGKYRFVVVEVKLATNAELPSAIVDQLGKYIALVDSHFKAFVSCYTEVYRQKRALGLWPGAELLPESIEIEEGVEGLIVAQGRQTELKKPLQHLKDGHPNLRIIPLDYSLTDFEGNLRCDQ